MGAVSQSVRSAGKYTGGEMTCRFSHLKFGSCCIIKITGDANCGSCGSDIRRSIDGKEVIYRGHSGEVDLFDLAAPFPCPSCESMCIGYSEVCGGMNVTAEIKALQNIDTV